MTNEIFIVIHVLINVEFVSGVDFGEKKMSPSTKTAPLKIEVEMEPYLLFTCKAKSFYHLCQVGRFIVVVIIKLRCR